MRLEEEREGAEGEEMGSRTPGHGHRRLAISRRPVAVAAGRCDEGF